MNLIPPVPLIMTPGEERAGIFTMVKDYETKYFISLLSQLTVFRIFQRPKKEST